MSVGEGIRRADEALLDGVFQPIADHLPMGMTSWSLGMSLQLGSLVFQVVSIIAPLFLYSVSVNVAVQSVLVLLCSFMLFVAFQRYRVLVRPDMMNPLRPMMRSMRVLGIIFLVYNGWTGSSISSFRIWDYLNFLSLFIFVIGLYFMACQLRPPKARSASSWRSSFWRRAVAR